MTGHLLATMNEATQSTGRRQQCRGLGLLVVCKKQTAAVSQTLDISLVLAERSQCISLQRYRQNMVYRPKAYMQTLRVSRLMIDYKESPILDDKSTMLYYSGGSRISARGGGQSGLGDGSTGGVGGISHFFAEIVHCYEFSWRNRF